MDAVRLREFRVATDPFEKERNQGQVELFGQVGIDSFEGLDIVGSIVSREAHTGQEDAYAGMLEALDQQDLVGAGGRNWQSAEAIIAAKLEDHDGWFGVEDVGQALNSVACSISADSQIDDVVVVTGGIEQALEIVGVALAGRNAQAGGEAVAERHDHRPAIGRGIGCRCFGRFGGCRLLFLMAGTAGA